MWTRLAVVSCLTACATGARAQPVSTAAALSTDARPTDPTPDASVADRAPVDAAGAPIASVAQVSLTIHAQAALAFGASGATARAFEEWDAYLHEPSLAMHEKDYVHVRADELGARTTAAAALAVVAACSSLTAHAALGDKAAVALQAEGKVDDARKWQQTAAAARAALGWTRAPLAAGPGDPTRLGFAVPLSGRAAAVGEVALRGAMMAIGESRPAEQVRRFQLLVRDAASEKGAGDRSGAELAQQEAVVGIVGSPEPGLVEESQRAGVPLLALDDKATGGQTTAFQVIHGADARTVTLARRALGQGVRRFAILGPDSAAGKHLAEVFEKTVVAGGGKLVGLASYIAGANSFSTAVASLRKGPPFEALFVPDDADRLELLAPALAVADLWAKPWGTPAPTSPRTAPPPGIPDLSKRRYVLLLSTARLVSARLLKNAGRYVQGALLCPGFYPDTGASPRGAFVARYRILYGQDPGATDAYAYDAVSLLRAAVERGAKNRAEVLSALRSQPLDGVTGTIKFGADHERIDAPTVYVVDGDQIKAAP